MRRHALDLLIAFFVIGITYTSVLGIEDSESHLEPTFDTTIDFKAELDTAVCDTSLMNIEGNRDKLLGVISSLKGLLVDRNRVISIVQIGDSHLQAGFLSETIRNHFQRDFGNAGRGLIVPLKITGTNEPRDYVITTDNKWSAARCADWNPWVEVGLGGAVIATNDKDISFTVSSNEPFERITVFHHAEAPFIDVEPQFALDIVCEPSADQSNTPIALNQSTDKVMLTARVTDPNFAKPIFYGFSLENNNSGVLHHAIGINGASYTHYNRSPQIIEQLRVLKPDLIIVSLGTNDAYPTRFNKAESLSQMRKLVCSIVELHPDAAVLLVTPMEFYSSSKARKANPNVESVRGNIKTIAEEFELPYWDMYAAAGGRGAMDRWFKNGMAQKDKIHLTELGYRVQGDMLYQAIINLYNQP